MYHAVGLLGRPDPAIKPLLRSGGREADGAGKDIRRDRGREGGVARRDYEAFVRGRVWERARQGGEGGPTFAQWTAQP